MPDLIAQGSKEHYRWRRPLPELTSGREIVLGRADSDWNVPWDSLISRKHARVKLVSDNLLAVTRSVTARNPVFYQGEQIQHFNVTLGEHFVIGETTFTFVNRPGTADSSRHRNITERSYDHTDLRRRNFRDAASRIQMLSRLPDLITSSETDEELLVRMTSILLQATPAANVVAIVSSAANEHSPRILHYDNRSIQNHVIPVSSSLVRRSIEMNESVLHIWSEASEASVRYTTNESVDWAFCVPLRNESCPGWAIYVTGNLSEQVASENYAEDEIGDDLKFAELVGSMVANLRQRHRLERRQASMRQFFSPIVMEALASRDPNEVLKPREANLTVMFCDLRGFTRQSEEHASELFKLLQQVSEALGVMTRAILDQGGVIGDFHGDAAMGFWGWPLAQSDAPRRAIEAAMQIRTMRLTSFQHGIGVATGLAVAGQIGTVDQVKVTAFGPVVNLASRLEGMTKIFGVQTIIDAVTANHLMTSSEANIPIRKLATVRPAGVQQPLEIFELQSNELNSNDLQSYSIGLAKFNEGEWTTAKRELSRIVDRDPPSRFLVDFIDRNQAMPPVNWAGVIELSKG